MTEQQPEHERAECPYCGRVMSDRETRESSTRATTAATRTTIEKRWPMTDQQRVALGLRPRTIAGVLFWLRYYSWPARVWQRVRWRVGVTLHPTPYAQRWWSRWLHPLRVLCSFGWHRDDGALSSARAVVNVRHCGRCFRPWIKAR